MLELVRELAGSPYLWAAVFVIAALDALLPFMPSETTVVLVGVLIAPSSLGLAELVLTAAAGAFAGDSLAYLLGRTSGPRVLARLRRRERGIRAQEWAQRQLERRGRLLIVFARYVPGGRAATLATGLPRRLVPAARDCRRAAVGNAGVAGRISRRQRVPGQTVDRDGRLIRLHHAGRTGYRNHPPNSPHRHYTSGSAMNGGIWRLLSTSASWDRWT